MCQEQSLVGTMWVSPFCGTYPSLPWHCLFSMFWASGGQKRFLTHLCSSQQLNTVFKGGRLIKVNPINYQREKLFRSCNHSFSSSKLKCTFCLFSTHILSSVVSAVSVKWLTRMLVKCSRVLWDRCSTHPILNIKWQKLTIKCILLKTKVTNI